MQGEPRSHVGPSTDMLGSDARVKVKIRRGVDVTAHRRTLLFRVGTVAVLAAGALIGIATPAFADTTMTVSQTQFDMGAGDRKGMDVTLGGGPATNVKVS